MRISNEYIKNKKKCVDSEAASEAKHDGVRFRTPISYNSIKYIHLLSCQLSIM